MRFVCFIVLLEGSPGVGKTSLVAALGRYSGHSVVRINLSEQVRADPNSFYNNEKSCWFSFPPGHFEVQLSYLDCVPAD